MAEEIPPYVLETKKLLEALIPKKLAEKHLARPPFGLLKDIFQGIISATGFASDLYTPEELSADMVKPTWCYTKFKRTKMLKLISCRR